ncbi:MAG TPA: carbohydrate-binding family 6 protein [Opitutaceae bacterium]|nr:carbohydrate-binding family 6 protein [Opitutaceae bacterium]
MKRHSLHFFALVAAFPCMVVAAEVTLDRHGLEPPALFAADEIAAALTSRGDTVTLDSAPGRRASARIVFALTTAGEAGMSSEGFSIRTTGTGGAKEIRITASDTAGLLYGGLELAEQIRLGGLDGVADTERTPAFAMRGVKFNIPLDVRTPSYTDMSDSAQANIATVWDFEFWREFIDRLARDRYNYVGLWNLHPFPSLVRVPGYEDVALDDVQRTTFPFAENYSTRTDDFVTTDMLARVETVRKMTMDEKIAFWRRVMAYGKDRNVDFYVITWNTYTYGTGGRHGITNAIDNPATIDYFRRSVAALLRTYPLLRGIGVTAGENMGNSSSGFDQKEEWLFATYGQGMLDAAADSPGRKIRFIHRQHETRAQEMAGTFAPLTQNPDIDFIFSFKYAQAHVMSSTVQPFNRNFLADLDGEKTIWEWRNDDTYHFRWGAPDFVREFVENARHDAAIGFCYGSDQWIWGREFLSKQPTTPRQLEIAKHWFDWMLWGRLAYDPSLGNDRIAAILTERFPEVPGPSLLDAWQHASMIYPLTTGFHWGEYDFQWYIEGCKSRPGPAQTESGFHDVNRFITLGTHPGTDNLTIPEYVENVVSGNASVGTTPPQVAAQLHEHSTAALAAIDAMDAANNAELRATLADIRAMALLGRYYAHKIAGATELALFRRTGEEAHHQRAVDELTRAAGSWDLYIGAAAALYKNPLWTNRVGNVDWSSLREHVAHDIAIAREAKPLDTDQARDRVAK